MEETEKHDKKQYDWLKGYQWTKGKSGNPKGRPKGKTLKEFARQYLENLPDEEKIEYLATLPAEIVWKMAEGNPHTASDLAVNVDTTGLNKKQKEVLNNIIYAQETSNRQDDNGDTTGESLHSEQGV